MPKPHYHGRRQRLRERFLKSGLDSFHDYEAVELLLTLAIPQRDVKVPAKLAIERFKSLRGVLDAPLEELREIPGLGEVAPVALRIIKEAANRYLQQKSQEAFSLTNQQVLFDYCRSALGSNSDEVFKVFYLDSGYRILGDGMLAWISRDSIRHLETGKRCQGPFNARGKGAGVIFDISTSSRRKSSKTSKPSLNNSAKSRRMWVARKLNPKGAGGAINNSYSEAETPLCHM